MQCVISIINLNFLVLSLTISKFTGRSKCVSRFPIYSMFMGALCVLCLKAFPSRTALSLIFYQHCCFFSRIWIRISLASSSASPTICLPAMWTSARPPSLPLSPAILSPFLLTFRPHVCAFFPMTQTLAHCTWVEILKLVLSLCSNAEQMERLCESKLECWKRVK